MTVDDIPFNEADDESRLALQRFPDLATLGVVIPRIAPHNSDARQLNNTSNCTPAIIVDHFYASAALNAHSSDSFIKYVRDGLRDAYYGEADDQSVSEHYHLRSRCKSQQKESRFNDIMGVCALWKKHFSSVGKKKVFVLRISLVTKAFGSGYNQ
jgi:hypothetical protein